jgi:thiamine-phosphate pyrophosphorylase
MTLRERIIRHDHTLPPLILIGDRFTDEKMSDRIVEAVRGGVRWVHLRDHKARSNAFELVVPTLIARIRSEATDAAVSVGGRPDVARHLSLHYHGRTHPDAIAEARKSLAPSTVIGYSAHSSDEAAAAVASGADYVYCSPIFPTTSKPEADPVGLDALRACCDRLGSTPVFALGGISPENLTGCLEAGAHGVAVLSGILNADSPARAAGAYLKAIELSRPATKLSRSATPR